MDPCWAWLAGRWAHHGNSPARAVKLTCLGSGYRKHFHRPELPELCLAGSCNVSNKGVFSFHREVAGALFPGLRTPRSEAWGTARGILPPGLASGLLWQAGKD